VSPLLLLGLNIAFVAAGELLLKRGAIETAHIAVPAWVSWLGVTALGSWWVWASIVAHLLGFAAWMMVLRVVPLNLAFSAGSAVQVLVPLGAWGWLGEAVSGWRCCGILLVVAGIFCIATPLMRAEEKL